MNTILVPVTLEPDSQEIVDAAAAWARIWEAKMLLVHVVDRDSVGAVERARQKLSRLAESTTVACDYNIVASGDIERNIVHTARATKAALIVMATHGRIGMRRAFEGSIAEHVLRHAPCPVVTLGPEDMGVPPHAMRRILAPTDFSEASQRAVRCAAALAVRTGANLCLLHVVQLPIAIDPMIGGAWNLPTEEMEESAKRSLDDIRATLDAPECTTAAISGVGWEHILGYASANAIDLIVMSTHGREGMRRAFIGSTAEAVIRRAPCPVLAMRADVPFALTGEPVAVDAARVGTLAEKDR